MTRRWIAASAICLAFGAVMAAQGTRPASPAGTAATEIGGSYVTRPGADGPTYQGGKWIEMTFGRPIKRGRDLWGSGADYGKTIAGDAPVWRAGANLTTRLKTELPLVINGKTVPVGEYSIFIDLKPNNWTFIVSNWPAQTRYEPENKNALYGAYGYTPDKDVVRAPMTLTTLPISVDQLDWVFADMTNTGGKMAIMWDNVLATVPFTVGQ